MLHHAAEGLVVGQSSRVWRVLLGVPVCRVGGDLRRDVVSNPLRHAIGVGEQRAELVVEGKVLILRRRQLGQQKIGPRPGTAG
ncbi:MAG: hypothetical protein H0T71_13215 [Acidobacteria bacterium]|nr:hypothetical protein [Acidobacteriota bacterium]